MSEELQRVFKALAKGEKIYVSRVPSQNDLCALFTVRASHLYLRPSGRLSFVLPLAALTRSQFENFRTGRFGTYNIAWEQAWTMDDGVRPLFPVPSAVVFGRKRAIAARMPENVRAYEGQLPMRDAPEELADQVLRMTEGAPAPAAAQALGGSTYRKAFRAGAVLFPRVFVLIEPLPTGRLGSNSEAPPVTSKRVRLEKEPWRSLPSITGQVESEFIRPMLVGESIVPFRLTRPFEVALPILEDGRILTAELALSTGYPYLASRTREIERLWADTGKDRYLFTKHIDYMRQLTGQFPIRPLRVVFAASGTLPAACVIRDDRAVVEHILYWAAPETETEAHYLTAILNSETARDRAARYQARGQWGARHFDKVMFNLPIPRFDPGNPLHTALATAAQEAEALAAAVEIPEATKFQRARKLIRNALADAGISQKIDTLVAQLLDTPAGGKAAESGEKGRRKK
jgi:hypothetical protein